MEVCDDTFIPPGLSDVRTWIHHCPRCIWTYLQPVDAVEEARWLCSSCGQCWRVERGRLRPIDPVMCDGCATRSRDWCIRRMQAEFPRFGLSMDDAPTG
jgi:hypothetical protein